MTTGTLQSATFGKLFVLFWISKLVYSCLTSQTIICICESMNDVEKFTYHTKCFKRRTNEELFSLFFTKHGYLDVKCKTEELLDESYFETQMLQKATQLVFSNCNMSNQTLISLLERVIILSLTIKSRRQIKFLGDMIAVNLPSLKELILSANGIQNVSRQAFRMISGLYDLDLSKNQIKTLPSDLFSHLSNLTSLNLEGNCLLFIPATLFRGLFKLEKLLLSSNRLRNVPSGTFYDLKSLKVLKLDNNELVDIVGGMLWSNSRLKYLDISRNFLKRLPKGILSAATNLETLDISGNNLQVLPLDLVSAKESLRILELNDCNMTSLSSHFFDGAPNLLRLSMRSNKITVLKDYLFTSAKLLRYLDLSHNKIDDLIGSPFLENKGLQVLKVNNNNLRNVSKYDFKGLPSLTNLDISFNFIENIEAESFSDLLNVVVINASNNRIISVKGKQPFGPSEKLEVIDISWNNLKLLPDGWEAYKSLKELIAWNNKIISLTVPMVASRESKVFLQNNEIMFVNISLLNKAYRTSNNTTSEDVPMYLMENNPLRCDCHLYEFYKYFSGAYPATPPARFYDGHKLTCDSPWNLKSKKIVLLEKEEFTCNITRNCPKPCFCSFQQCDAIITVDCRNKQLRAIPNKAPRNVNILKMEKNNLTSLAGIEDWGNLTEIYLDENFIQSEEWSIPRKLLVLSLTRNNLTWLPSSVKSHANALKSFKMKVAGNPWSCNCSLKTWMSQHFKQVVDVAEVFCLRRDGTMTSLPLMNTTDSELCPPDTWPLRLRLSFYLIACAVVAVIIIIIVALYYRNKRTILAYIYTHFQCLFQCFFQSHDFDDDKIFDAFVSYSSDDRDIALELIEEMENKPPHYRLCIHERDWIPGNLITDSIVHSVQNSKRTILVISKHFLKSIWFHVEFHVAYYQMLEDKTDRIIVIVKGELPSTDSFDKELKHLLSTKTYVLWGEKWFWEKLRYSMPYKRKECDLCCNIRKKQDVVVIPQKDSTSLVVLNRNVPQTENHTDLSVVN